MVAISVDLTVEGWTLDRILAERMQTRSSYASAMVGVLRAAGYELVPTGQRAPLQPDPSGELRRRGGCASCPTRAYASESLPSEEVMTMSDTQIEIDIPCDVQDEDELGMPYALLSEARDPSRIVPGAIVITADDGGSGLRPSPLADAAGRPHGGPPRAAAW